MNNRVEFEGINFHATTYTGVGLTLASTGKAVTLVAPGTVGLGSDGNYFLGIVTKFESDGNVSVQDGGYCKAPAATKISARTNITVDGAGNVKAGSAVARPIVVDNKDWATDGKLDVLLG